jgi:hypothetical protein
MSWKTLVTPCSWYFIGLMASSLRSKLRFKY